MPSFQITVSPTRKGAARIVSEVRRQVQQLLVEAKELGITQSELAKQIDVHRSVINREVRGRRDMSIGRLGEIGAVVGKRPVFRFEDIAVSPQSNVMAGFSSDEPSTTCEIAEMELST